MIFLSNLLLFTVLKMIKKIVRTTASGLLNPGLVYPLMFLSIIGMFWWNDTPYDKCAAGIFLVGGITLWLIASYLEGAYLKSKKSRRIDVTWDDL